METPEQYKFVKQFTITPPVKRKVKQLRKWCWLKFWKTNLTRLPQAPPKEKMLLQQTGSKLI